MIETLWLYPPLAFARLGPSDTPADNYSWGPNDVTARGSGKTTVVPAPTLSVAADGSLTCTTPEALTFKDEQGFRPVCPFFELWGAWRQGARLCTGPITIDVLEREGIAASEVIWTVTVANLKPFRYTQARGDRIEASVHVSADSTTRRPLCGKSPDDPLRLVPEDACLPLGWVQAARPSAAFPEYRLRFTPPRGLIYAATDFQQRMKALEERAAASGKSSRWVAAGRPFQLPPEQLILNPAAVWSTWSPKEKPFETHRDRDRDFRTMPEQCFAFDDTEGHLFTSLGLVDDISDGLVRCRIGRLEAVARVAVAPPRYAPDRRPMVSVADGLKDRVDRAEVSADAYVADPQTGAEVRDLLERIHETQGLMNLDLLNGVMHSKNAGIAASAALPPPKLEAKLFPRIENLRDRPLPLTELARQRHRRLLAVEVIEDRLREDPTLIDRLIRPPLSGEPYFDRRMPPLTTGSDSRPMHLTRRQYDLLQAWANRLRLTVKEGP
jgi:hypothetical protein